MSGNKRSIKGDIPLEKVPFDIDIELKRGLQYHQSGQLQKAEEIYKRILEINPNHSDSLHLLGVIAHQAGKNDIAVDLINKAIRNNPESSFYYNNLGSAYKAQGELDEAITCFQKALELNPDYVDALNNLGSAYKGLGELGEAISCYRKALQLSPDYAEVYYNMGNAYKEQGELDEAVSCYKKALELKPDNAKVYNNIGNALQDLNKLSEAISCYRKALELKPDYAEAYYNMGNSHKEQGELGEAVTCYQKALQLKPDLCEAYNNLGNAYKDMGELDEAISCCRKVLQLNPDYAEAYYNMGNAYKEQDELGEAISCYQRALQLNPDYADAYNNIAYTYKEQGKLEEAVSCYQRALELKPDYASAHSNFLFCLHYGESIDPVQLFSRHQQWADQHASPLATTILPHLNDRMSHRRLRIGYVSPDFRVHSVAYFIEAVLASHDHSAFEIYCYSDVSIPDSTTTRFKNLSDCWRDIFRMSDKQVADRIRNDRIDVLVDLAGHTAKNRMLMFARKPAPIQVTYIGYPDTTGLSTMDYRITDSLADPPGQTDHLYTEKLVRLPFGFLCYRPHEESPAVSNLPAEDSGTVTFGSFNNRSKITLEIVQLWSKILTSVPNARLILKAKSLSDPETQKRLQKMFIDSGVSPGMIELFGYSSSLFEHLELYNSIDIGLDTFPYNGTTTTCEAMWMGVPVIVMAGRTHESRVGVSLLSSVGLTDLIAESADKYLGKAVKLAGDLNHLKRIRASLRDMMSNSSLTDFRRVTRSLEEAYQRMWKHWCEQNNRG